VGTFSNSATNYSAGRKFGDNLILPAAGYRDSFNGELDHRGNRGYYLSSTAYGSSSIWYLYFNSAGALASDNFGRSYGFSVRCIAE
jgi:hypothetical protein